KGGEGVVFPLIKGGEGVVSAGMLIDRAGLKGRTCGSAQVSTKHANFIISKDKARFSDVLKLINIIRRTVQRKFAVKLDLEIEIWK
ncbi:MAG: hypothetical protein QME51_11240, partial [Planctomycetota bacterium]|nr:hypothetical protein [Planctomycetota bacterium]